MKRLLQISLDTLLTSVLPIIMWILLGFITTKEISNVFSLTYPLQFLYMIFVSLFGIGPNITAKKENDSNIVSSNIIIGTIFVGIITLFFSIYVDIYIRFMNMDVTIYHSFCIYSIICLYFTFIVEIIGQKLYYENRNKESNHIHFLYSFSNFFFILFFSLVFKDKLSIGITLVLNAIIIFIILFRYLDPCKFVLKLKKNIHYSSFSILRDIGMLLIYGIGLGNSFSYGEQYALAINFEGLTTDTQWDMLSSIETASKIDLSSNQFNYKKSLKNAYQLLFIILGSTLIMNVTFYWYFKPNIKILLIILLVQIVDMLVDPLKTFRWSYLQICDNQKKHNIVYAFSRVGRFLCSFIPSAFCTYIGQLFSMIYLYVYSKIACRGVSCFKKK